jgi:hypothetical protein
LLNSSTRSAVSTVWFFASTIGVSPTTVVATSTPATFIITGHIGRAFGFDQVVGERQRLKAWHLDVHRVPSDGHHGKQELP